MSVASSWNALRPVVSRLRLDYYMQCRVTPIYERNHNDLETLLLTLYQAPFVYLFDREDCSKIDSLLKNVQKYRLDIRPEKLFVSANHKLALWKLSLPKQPNYERQNLPVPNPEKEVVFFEDFERPITLVGNTDIHWKRLHERGVTWGDSQKFLWVKGVMPNPGSGFVSPGIEGSQIRLSDQTEALSGKSSLWISMTAPGGFLLQFFPPLGKKYEIEFFYSGTPGATGKVQVSGNSKSALAVFAVKKIKKSDGAMLYTLRMGKNKENTPYSFQLFVPMGLCCWIISLFIPKGSNHDIAISIHRAIFSWRNLPDAWRMPYMPKYCMLLRDTMRPYTIRMGNHQTSKG